MTASGCYEEPDNDIRNAAMIRLVK